jgi:hypothetical protein
MTCKMHLAESSTFQFAKEIPSNRARPIFSSRTFQRSSCAEARWKAVPFLATNSSVASQPSAHGPIEADTKKRFERRASFFNFA